MRDLLLFLLALSGAGVVTATTCPLDLDSAAEVIQPSCYANSTPSTGSTGCCWLVSAAYLFAIARHANLTGDAFLPADVTAACLSAFPALLLRRGLVRPSLLANGSCSISSNSVPLVAGSSPCLFSTVSALRATVNLSPATALCNSPNFNLSANQNYCNRCQKAVTTAVFTLLKLSKSKNIIPCGIAATLGIWSSTVPRLHPFESYVFCLVQILENTGGLTITNMMPSTPDTDTVNVTVASANNTHGRSAKIAAGSAVAALASIAAIVFLALSIQKRRRRVTLMATTHTTDWDPTASNGPPLPTEGLYIFTKAELKKATDNYDEALVLGEGGAGKVYLGRLPSGHQIAIKKFYRERKLGEFYREIQILAKLRHRNLTTLVGYCLGRKVHALVYEYMAGGNLAHALHNGELSWTRRVEIATDVAEGLAYLHKFPEGAVVHRDVKPTNVLLPGGGEGSRAKLSDFGVSRIMPMEVTHVSTEIRGTMGYVDPDSFHIGHVSESADVYSFGVMLLELVTGLKAVVPTPSGGAESIVHAARGAILRVTEGGVRSIVDPKLGAGWDRATVGAVFELACRCVRPYKEERPEMEEVLAVLKRVAAEVARRSPSATEEASDIFSDATTSTTPTSRGSTPSVHARSL